MVDCTDKKECYCNCGYRCGGPGICKLDTLECIQKHFIRDCGHKFGGPLIKVYDGCQSIVCKNCGLSALAHDEWVGP